MILSSLAFIDSILEKALFSMTLGELMYLSVFFVPILWWDPALFFKFRDRKNSIKNMSNKRFKQYISRYTDLTSLNEKDLDETLTATKDMFDEYFNTQYIMPLWKRIISWITNIKLAGILLPFMQILLDTMGLIPSIMLGGAIFIILATFVNMVISLTTIRNMKKLMGIS